MLFDVKSFKFSLTSHFRAPKAMHGNIYCTEISMFAVPTFNNIEKE